MKFLIPLLTILTGCGTIFDGRTQIEATDVELTPAGFTAAQLSYVSGQDRSLTYQRDAEFVDLTYGTDSQFATQQRGRDNQRYEAMGQQWADGARNTIEMIGALAPLFAGAPAVGGATTEAAGESTADTSDKAGLAEVLSAILERLDNLEAPTEEAEVTPAEPETLPDQP